MAVETDTSPPFSGHTQSAVEMPAVVLSNSRTTQVAAMVPALNQESDYDQRSKQILDAIMIFRQIRDIFTPEAEMLESNPSVRYFVSVRDYDYFDQSEAIKYEIYAILVKIEEKLEQILTDPSSEKIHELVSLVGPILETQYNESSPFAHEDAKRTLRIYARSPIIDNGQVATFSLIKEVKLSQIVRDSLRPVAFWIKEEELRNLLYPVSFEAHGTQINDPAINHINAIINSIREGGDIIVEPNSSNVDPSAKTLYPERVIFILTTLKTLLRKELELFLYPGTADPIDYSTKADWIKLQIKLAIMQTEIIESVIRHGQKSMDFQLYLHKLIDNFFHSLITKTRQIGEGLEPAQEVARMKQ